MENKLFLLMQVNDSVFPIGGYTQSYGLETYIQKDLITDAQSAQSYICNNLHTSFLYTDLLAVSLAFDADTKKLAELDKTLEAIKAPKEIRSASLKLGSRFVKIVLTSDVIFENDKFKCYAEQTKNPNHCVAYGVFCSSLGVSKQEALSFYTYSTCSAMVTNSVKTVPLSQTQGQKMLTQLSGEFCKIINKVQTLDESYLGIAMPAYDIRCMQHETLYSRLYMS